MRAADTNLLVRILVQDDAKQAAAAEAFIRPGAWVSHLVLAEASWVLAAVYARSPSSLAESIRMLLQHESLVIQDADVVEAALVHFAARPSLGFSDCLILEIARKVGHTPLGTLDVKLGKLEGAQKI